MPMKLALITRSLSSWKDALSRDTTSQKRQPQPERLPPCLLFLFFSCLVRLFLPLISGISALNSTSSPCSLAPFSQPLLAPRLCHQWQKYSRCLWQLLAPFSLDNCCCDFRIWLQILRILLSLSPSTPLTVVQPLGSLACRIAMQQPLSYSASLPSVSPSSLC